MRRTCSCFETRIPPFNHWALPSEMACGNLFWRGPFRSIMCQVYLIPILVHPRTCNTCVCFVLFFRTITSSEILRALWHDGEVQLCPEGARYGHHGQRLSQRRTLRSRRRPASSLRPSMADGKTWCRLHRGRDGAGATRSGRDDGSASVMVMRVASSAA